MNQLFSLALDGPSGAGKSSIAKEVAATLGFVYVDTGAIYRTVGYAVNTAGVSCKDEPSVMKILPTLNIEIGYDENHLQRMVLNGTDVSDEIRMPAISICASDVSALPGVRAFLLDMQREFANKYNVVMDGRDIGTVVLPNATLKVFLTASAETRAQRRLLQLKEKGVESSFEEVLKDIEYRDYQDTHRQTSPLKKADDAITLDTSDMTFAQSVEAIKAMIKQAQNSGCKGDS